MDPRTKRKCLTLKVNTNNPGIKTEDNAPNSGKIRKRVCWDMKSLEEQSNEMKNNKPKMKITEPKTPYHHIEEDDDEYLKQLNEINKIKPTVILMSNIFRKKY